MQNLTAQQQLHINLHSAYSALAQTYAGDNAAQLQALVDAYAKCIAFNSVAIGTEEYYALLAQCTSAVKAIAKRSTAVRAGYIALVEDNLADIACNALQLQLAKFVNNNM